MRLAVVASGNPNDISVWSGTPYFMTKALGIALPDVVAIESAAPPLFDTLRRGLRKLSGGRVEIAWTTAASQLVGRWTGAQIDRVGADVVVCIGNAPASAGLSRHYPTVHVSDSTVPIMADYYGRFANLAGPMLQQALKLDRASVLRSRLCFFATPWAAKSAIRDYGADPAKVHAIPWGPNIEQPPSVEDQSIVRSETCHLVFIGAEWTRKGGNIAVEAARSLARSGFPVQLHLIGNIPEMDSDEIIKVHGFISKKTPEGAARFNALMRQAAFLFLPTRQECYGIVFPEANAFAVPAITTDTGGVSGAVEDGVNGYLLSLSAGPQDYADLIAAIWRDPERYLRLRRTSLQRFRETLNWTAWGNAAGAIMREAADEGRFSKPR